MVVWQWFLQQLDYTSIATIIGGQIFRWSHFYKKRPKLTEAGKYIAYYIGIAAD